jgi:hypothetical protein
MQKIILNLKIWKGVMDNKIAPKIFWDKLSGIPDFWERNREMFGTNCYF